MAPTAEEKLQYLLTVLKYTDLGQPDYKAIAEATGQKTANAAQKKFKAYIEQSGFAFVDKQIVDPEDGDGTSSAPAKAKKPNGSTTTTGTSTPKAKTKKANPRSSVKSKSNTKATMATTARMGGASAERPNKKRRLDADSEDANGDEEGGEETVVIKIDSDDEDEGGFGNMSRGGSGSDTNVDGDGDVQHGDRSGIKDEEGTDVESNGDDEEYQRGQERYLSRGRSETIYEEAV